MSKKDSAKHRVPPYKRPIFIVGFLVILLVAVGASILVCRSLDLHDLASQPDSSTNTQNGSSSASTGDTILAEPADKAPQYEGEDPNLAGELTGVITYKDVDPEAQVLHSVVNIDQYLREDGQCIFNIKSGDNIMKTAVAVATPDITTSVCGPFSISLSGLSDGIYVIEVLLSGDDKTGTIIDEIEL